MRKWYIAVIISLGIVSLTGCNNMKKTPEAQQILQDLREEYPSASIESCNSIQIERSQLFEEEKKWLADISISGIDAYSNLSAKLSVEYDYYDGQGWMLDVENSEAPEIYADSVVVEMSEEDMIYTVGNFDNLMEFVSGSFDPESGMQYINYKKNLYDTYFFEGVLTGFLECCYINTDAGWQVNNNFDETKVSIKTKNVPGKYQHIGASAARGDVINIENISEDGKVIKLIPVKDTAMVDWLGGDKYEYSLCSGEEYHAKLLEINYPSNHSKEEYLLKATYNIVDATNKNDDKDDVLLRLVVRKENDEQEVYIDINNSVTITTYHKMK